MIGEALRNITHEIRYSEVTNDVLFLKNAGTTIRVGIEELFREMLTVLDESLISVVVKVICDHYISVGIGRRSRYQIKHITDSCDEEIVDCFIVEMKSDLFIVKNIESGVDEEIYFRNLVSVSGLDKEIESFLNVYYSHFFTIKGFIHLLSSLKNKDTKYFITTKDNNAHSAEKIIFKNARLVTLSGLMFPIDSKFKSDVGIFRNSYDLCLSDIVSV